MFAISLSYTRSQFHLHFMHAFFLREQIEQLFSAYSLALNKLSYEKWACKMLMKLSPDTRVLLHTWPTKKLLPKIIIQDVLPTRPKTVQLAQPTSQSCKKTFKIVCYIEPCYYSMYKMSLLKKIVEE
jgi:hypothetical protein